MAIMSLRPTIADIEAASLWLAGDADVFGASEPTICRKPMTRLRLDKLEM
jgi:hypothetical protein